MSSASAVYNDAAPHIRTLDHAECEAILARNHVGRIAFSHEYRLNITPLHYVYSDGWIYGRTAEGHKIRELTHSAYNWWPVVFEVDEIEEMFKWRSIVVHGGFNLIEHSANDTEWTRAVAVIRRLMPDALTALDPVPERNILFRISTAQATGRAAEIVSP